MLRLGDLVHRVRSCRMSFMGGRNLHYERCFAILLFDDFEGARGQGRVRTYWLVRVVRAR